MVSLFLLIAPIGLMVSAYTMRNGFLFGLGALIVTAIVTASVLVVVTERRERDKPGSSNTAEPKAHSWAGL